MSAKNLFYDALFWKIYDSLKNKCDNYLIELILKKFSSTKVNKLPVNLG